MLCNGLFDMVILTSQSIPRTRTSAGIFSPAEPSSGDNIDTQAFYERAFLSSMA